MTGDTVVLPTVAHCWNRIGVHGDRSCPELAEHIHCRNCPVYAAGGLRLYDRRPPADYLAEWTDRIAAPDPPPPGDTLPVVLFRVGPEWLALDVKHTVEVAPARTVRRVPHQNGGLLAGLVNIRGELQLAVSLRHLLGLDPAPEEPPTARHLVAEHDGARWVLPVDEVFDIRHTRAADLGPVPDTVSLAAATLTRGVFRWDDRAVGHLDPDRLFAALKRGFR